MEYINKEVGKLPKTFGLDSLKNGTNSTVKNLIENVQDTINLWINQYLEAVLRKVSLDSFIVHHGNKLHYLLCDIDL